MPFITEELWGQTTAKREKMLIHADWPTYRLADHLDEAADRELNWVITLIENIRSARAQMHVPAGLKVPLADDRHRRRRTGRMGAQRDDDQTPRPRGKP